MSNHNEDHECSHTAKLIYGAEMVATIISLVTDPNTAKRIDALAAKVRTWQQRSSMDQCSPE